MTLNGSFWTKPFVFLVTSYVDLYLKGPPKKVGFLWYAIIPI